jgi:hypothetical protein
MGAQTAEEQVSAGLTDGTEVDLSCQNVTLGAAWLAATLSGGRPLSGKQKATLHPKGLTLRAATITGRVDWTGCHFLSECTHSYPCPSPFVYPIDAALPLIDLHQVDYWQFDTSTSWGHAGRDWVVFATISGWGLATLFAAGLSGLVRGE